MKILSADSVKPHRVARSALGVAGIWLMLLMPQSAQAQAFSVVYTFSGSDGGNPAAGMIQDSAGNFYGTTCWGGPADVGTIFKLDTNGQQTVLHSFSGPDGTCPRSELLLGLDGNLYGTTIVGGTLSGGTLFRLGTSGNFKTLHNFDPNQDGELPSGALIQDSSGNLYGTTQLGGSSGLGVVFRMDLSGNETVLHNFAGTAGVVPRGGVVRDKAGNFYGTDSLGGLVDPSRCPTSGSVSGCGTVFKLDPTGAWTGSIYFNGIFADGDHPTAGLLIDQAGNLYGTTRDGGYSTSDSGTVFTVDPNGALKTLHTFAGSPTDGAHPEARLVRDPFGNLYGTTTGGTSDSTVGCSGPLATGGCGTVFMLDTAGNETILHNLTGGTDGSAPHGGLFLDASGNLYGTASFGANLTCPSSGIKYGCGTVFKISSVTSGLTVTLAGSGGGTVTSNPPGISCGTTCAQSLANGTMASLSAAPDAQSSFLGWSGPCSGTGSCDVVISGINSVTATFKSLADFSLSASAFTPTTITAGGSSTSTIDIAAIAGFSSAVTLSCSVQPAPSLAPRCSLSPNSTHVGTPATLTVTTTGPSATLHTAAGVGLIYAIWMPLLGMFALKFGFGSDQKKKGKAPAVLLSCALVASLASQIACGDGGNRDITHSQGTPSGSYTVTVTGISGSLQHSITTRLAVQ